MTINWMNTLAYPVWLLSLIIFILSWIGQFYGHIIEGNRPALMTSIKQSFLEAPLFTVEYIYPNLLELS